MNLTALYVDIIDALNIGVVATMNVKEDMEAKVTQQGGFHALVYQVGGDEENADAEDRYRIELYGDGENKTLKKASELNRRLCWDPVGSSYHFNPRGKGMIDDVVTAIRPAPFPVEDDRVAGVTMTHQLYARDW